MPDALYSDSASGFDSMGSRDELGAGERRVCGGEALGRAQE
jgi:hypothetical protein